MSVLDRKDPRVWEKRLSIEDQITLATLRTIERSVGLQHCDKCDMPLKDGVRTRCESCRALFGTFGIET